VEKTAIRQEEVPDGWLRGIMQGLVGAVEYPMLSNKKKASGKNN
jgi:hypothetical protein